MLIGLGLIWHSCVKDSQSEIHIPEGYADPEPDDGQLFQIPHQSGQAVGSGLNPGHLIWKTGSCLHAYDPLALHQIKNIGSIIISKKGPR